MGPNADILKSKLAQATRKPPPTAPSRFTQAIEAGRPWRPIRIPRLEIDAVMTLISTARFKAIESDVAREMEGIDLDLNTTTESTYELERARRTLAEAMREPDAKDPSRGAGPLGTLAEWDEVDPDVVADLWRSYLELKTELDPISMPLTADEIALIDEGIKKKDPRILRYCGARRLATWLLYTADQQSNSPTPSSTPSDAPSAG